MARLERLRPRQLPTFNKAEIGKMESLHKELGEGSLCVHFCDRLARQFSRTLHRSGKPAIQWDQVQDWFKKKQQSCKAKQTILHSKLHSLTPKASFSNSEPNKSAPPKVIASLPNNGPQTSTAPKVTNEKSQDLSELEFEAKSTRDGAWYDVSLFLTHRVLSSGEPEVRVRFVGFGSEEDEWVNVKTGVRERSLPLEPSECDSVKEGDIVLCFQDRKDQAIYFDAHIVQIQRRLHDIRGCRCLFLVRYDHDNSEEKLPLRRLCRRPSY